MNLTTINRLLKFLAVCLLAASGLAAFYQVRTQFKAETRLDGPLALRVSPPAAADSSPPLAAFEPYWSRPLRRADPVSLPLPPDEEEVDPEIEPAEPPLADPLRVKLVGTILESGRSRAIFVGPDGRIDLKGVGQDLELTPPGIRVEEIQLGDVVVSYRGRRLTLQLPAAEVR